MTKLLRGRQIAASITLSATLILGHGCAHKATAPQPPKFGASLIFPTGGSASGGGLTNAELRAVPVPVSGTVATGGLTDVQLRATPVPVSGTVTANAGSGTLAVSAATLPLPTGAATAAKQPALGTAGASSTDVISVQGIASGTALPVSGTVAVGTFPDNEPINVAQINGVAPLMGNGVTGTGSQRVTIASDNTAFPVNVGTFPDNEPINVAQIAGTAASVGNGVSGTGVQRVTIASDSTGNLGVAQASTTAGQLGPLVQGTASLLPPAGLSPGQTGPLSLDRNGGTLRIGLNSVVDYGAVSGAPWILPPETTEDFALRTAIDNQLDTDPMSHTAQNTAKHRVDNTTMAFTHSAGFNTNTGSITTINTGVAFSTYQYFPVGDGSGLFAHMKVRFTGTIAATNTTIDWGYFARPTTTPYAPTDGAYFRATSTGVAGCANSNGTETCSSVFPVSFGGATWSPTAGTEYDTIVYYFNQVAVFWVDLRDGNGYTAMTRVTVPASGGSTSLGRSSPISVRHAIGGVAASAVKGFTLIGYTVNNVGAPNGRLWPETASAMGLSGAQGKAGSTMGSTALYTNSLAPGAGAAMTNTTAALGTGLGGQFAAQPTLAANTDGIVCSFQNPAPTATAPGRTLIIDSVKISSVVTTVFVGGPVLYNYSLAWGHTNVSLATAEAQNTKASRRKPLGIQNFVVTAAVGTMPTGWQGDQIILSDVAIQPGEFIAVVAKNMGTVTSAGVVLFDVTITSHYQ